MDLQAIVSESVTIQDDIIKEGEEDVYVDLASLDFDKLRVAFTKTPRKNTLVFNLQEAIEQRVVRENLKDQETLAIFDLLKEGKDLSSKEIKEVKKVAAKTLETLKTEKLKIDNWRESSQIKAQVKSLIYNNLLYLPQESYSDEEVGVKTANVYQHIFTNYYGGSKNVYNQKASYNYYKNTNASLVNT